MERERVKNAIYRGKISWWRVRDSSQTLPDFLIISLTHLRRPPHSEASHATIRNKFRARFEDPSWPRPTLMKCSSARFRGWSGHVQASVNELNVASRAINRMTSLRTLSLSSSKAIWQMILWPRSPHAHDGDGYIMLPSRKRSPTGNEKRAWSRVVRLLFMTFLPSGM